MALGVVIAVGGGGYAISKKYDIGMDDISATIAYLEANAFGASSVAILDSQTHELAPTPAPTPAYTPNGSVKETPTPQFNYYDKELGKGFYIEGTPSFVNNITRLMETWKEVDPEVYSEYVGNYTPNKIVKSGDSFSKYAVGIEVIAIPENIEMFGGRDEIALRKFGLPNIETEWDNALKEKSGYVKSFLEQEKSKFDYFVKLDLMTQEQADKQLKRLSMKIDDGSYLDGIK